jgi:GNAT superfamily N-acetyltransferase
VQIRPLQLKDIPRALVLSRKAQWNQTKADWKLVLDQRSANNWVALIEGKIVGTVTTINYQDQFEWIGMVLVHPNFRRLGIAQNLMQKVLAKNPTHCYGLDASVMGKQLYLKLGFQEKLKVTRYHQSISHRIVPKPKTQIDPIGVRDLPKLYAFDQRIVQINRANVLRGLYTNGRGFLARDGHAIKGYLLTRAGDRKTYLGPLLCADPETAESLLNEALQQIGANDVCIDVPAQSTTWIKRLTERGFEVSRHFDRMQLGPCEHLLIESNSYAICGPALG